MRTAAAIVTWVYAAAFGIPTLHAANYLDDNGYLPTFRAWFEMYGGPWSRELAGHGYETIVNLLLAFSVTVRRSPPPWSPARPP